MRRNETLELACLLPSSHSMKPARKLRTSTDEARASVPLKCSEETRSVRRREVRGVPSIRCAHANLRESAGPRRSCCASFSHWTGQLRSRLVHGDGCVGRIGPPSRSDDRCPRLRCNQPRSRPYHCHGSAESVEPNLSLIAPANERPMRYCLVPCMSPCYLWCAVLDGKARTLKRAKPSSSLRNSTSRLAGSTCDHSASSRQPPPTSREPRRSRR